MNIKNKKKISKTKNKKKNSEVTLEYIKKIK